MNISEGNRKVKIVEYYEKNNVSFWHTARSN